MTYFLSYTEKPEAPVPRLATTGALCSALRLRGPGRHTCARPAYCRVAA